MAELACTAIGVLSFALEVCQGIVSYKQAWADCDDDMQNARNKAEVLCMMLKTLRETIEELQQTNPRIAADLEQKALSMRTSIEKLVKIVDRFKPAPFEAFPAKVRAQVRKGLYPFYKDAVKDAHVQLDQIQTILQTSLLIYNWQDTRAARVMQISIYEEMRSMHSTLKNTISSTGMPPPSLLQVVCDRQREEVPIMLMQKRSSRDDNQFSNRHIWTEDESEIVTRAYTYHSRLLNIAISMSFSMTRGAGGFSIAPSLHVQSIWSESSERYHEASELMIGCILDESIIPRLQTAFLERRLSPFDTFYSLPPYRDRVSSLMDMMFHVMSTQCLDLNPPQAFSNLIKFMLECGMKPKTDDRELFGGLLALFGLIELAVNDLPSVLELIELRGPLQLWHLTHYPEILKRNLRLILSQDEELCHMPRITKAIIRESEDELRKALASGDASPDDIVDESGRISALEFAFGWPKGIQVLLQSGANVPAHFDAFVSGEGEQYNASAALLLQGGYCFGWYDVFWSTKGNDDGTRQALLVHELAERRIRLWMLIKSSLLADEIPPLDDGSMLDGYASNLCKALAGLGIDIPKSLCVLIEGNQDSIYQKLADMDMPAIRLMDSLYDAGFHDVDLPNSEGRTPLMRVWPFVHNIPEFFRRVAWLMSKGASIERRLPQSNAKVAHLLTNRIIRCHFLYPRGVNESPYNASDEWKKLAAGWKDAYFFVPTIHDHCNCACSLGGCTTLSVALRGILSWIPRFELEGHMDHLRPWFLSLVAWQSSWPHLARVVLRSLTFDALGLTHTCCIEINAYDAYPIQTGRSDAEISRILDEEHCLLQDFEELLQEMESKFDELGLSIEEFLDDYWYDCVIKYLSRRDSYDEHHVREARRLGIFLEAKEFHIPNVASLSICSQIREL